MAKVNELNQQTSVVKDEKAFDIKKNVGKLVDELNELANDKSTTASAIQSKLTLVNDELVKLNKALKSEFYESLYAEEKPMYAACKQPLFSKASLKSSIDKVGKITYEISYKDAVMDLLDFENASTKKIAADGQWRYEIEYLCRHIAKKVAKDIGASNVGLPGYKMSQDAQALFEKNPFSYKTLNAELQKIVDMIVGNDVIKITSNDTKFVEHLIAKEGKTILSVRTADKKTLARLILKVIHRNIEHAQFSMEYKMVENKA